MGRLGVGGVLAFFALWAQAGAAATTETRVEVAPGESLRVVQAGVGAPVVLVPGLLGSAFGYRQLIDQLADAGYRAIVIEPLGIGGSGRPEKADYSLTAQADRLAVAIERLGLDRPLVVAHSVGGSMALRLALRHPERVRAIVSLDGGPAEAAATPGFRRAMRFSFLVRLFGTGRIRRTVRSTLVERSFDPRWVTEEVVDGYLAAGSGDLSATLAAYGQMAKAREPQALQPRLAEVGCPVLLVIGAANREGGITEDEIRILEQRLPSFAIERVPGAGHFVFEEAPQAVVAAVAAMTVRPGQASAGSVQRAAGDGGRP